MVQINYGMFLTLQVLVTLATYGLLWLLFFYNPDTTVDVPSTPTINKNKDNVLPSTSTAMSTLTGLTQ